MFRLKFMSEAELKIWLIYIFKNTDNIIIFIIEFRILNTVIHNRKISFFLIKMLNFY